MKDKLIQIRADAELLAKIEYLKFINGYRTSSETIRKTIEKEYRTVERPQGKWIITYPLMSDMQKSFLGYSKDEQVKDTRFPRSECNLCGCAQPIEGNQYCPQCGAIMDGDQVEPIEKCDEPNKTCDDCWKQLHCRAIERGE